MVEYFIPPEELEILPCTFLLIVYGYILFKAAVLIGDGSEILLDHYGPGVVGGFVIPVLGALPDSAIILFSGMGDPETVATNLQVGVGTLAGSTIMLLTLPWAGGVYMGRLDIDERSGETRNALTKGSSFTETGVTSYPDVLVTARMMMFTALTYLIIQIPAFMYLHSDDPAAHESTFALIGFIVAAVGFVVYSVYQLTASPSETDVEKAQVARAKQIASIALKKQRDRTMAAVAFSLSRMGGATQDFDTWSREVLQGTHAAPREYLVDVFHKLDQDKSGHLDLDELKKGMKLLGLSFDDATVEEMYNHMDEDKDGFIQENEFCAVVESWLELQAKKAINPESDMEVKSVLNRQSSAYEMIKTTAIKKRGSVQAEVKTNERSPLLSYVSAPGEEEEEEEEEEGEHEPLSTALWMLLAGTVLVMIFSDPMVDVISRFAVLINVNPFYVSFIVTPLASNAAEVVSSLMFAQKKTNKTISLTLSALYGAATMNNTLGLSVFLGIVYFQKLSWNYSAEVISILFVSFAVGANSQKQTIYLWQAVLVALLFPLSLVLVAVMEANGLQ